MLRLRLAPLAVTAGLLLACGCTTPSSSSCSSSSGGGFFSRLCSRTRRPTNDCCCAVEAGAPCCTGGCCPGGGCDGGCCDGGPPLVDPGAGFVTPGVQGMPAVPSWPTAPPPGLPLAPAPRLVPQPAQSQPLPYNPPG